MKPLGFTHIDRRWWLLPEKVQHIGGEKLLEQSDVVELVDSATCLDINVPGRDGLKVLVGWYLLRHHRVGAKCLSGPGRKANHPVKP